MLRVQRQALWVAPDDDVLYISARTKVDKFAEVLRYRLEESLQVNAGNNTRSVGVDLCRSTAQQERVAIVTIT